MNPLKPFNTMEALQISKDLSGGVRFKLGPSSFVLPPKEAIKMAAAILDCAGAQPAGKRPPVITTIGVKP